MEVVRTIRRESIVRADWTRVAPHDRSAFELMVHEMEGRGILLAGHAPIWAWHSCHPSGGRPTPSSASSLLSLAQLEQGIFVMELDVPEHRVLLSSYFGWNQVLDHYMDGAAWPPQWFGSIFLTQPRAVGDDIQACLPFLDPRWVRRIRRLKLFGLKTGRPRFRQAVRQFGGDWERKWRGK
jgi:hypothetical protein